MTDTVVLAGFGFLGSIVTAISAYSIAKLNRVAKVGEATHILVNSERGSLLKLYAVSARRAADEHPESEADQVAANLAEKVLADHERQQTKMDVVVPV